MPMKNRISQKRSLVSLRSMALLLVAALALPSCATVSSWLAGVDPASRFTPLPADPRVRYEPGAEELAERAASELPGAVAQVETEHGRPFREPVEVYVCATEESFNALTQSSEGTRGAVTRRLYVSGLLNKKKYHDAVPLVLAHELSHLHMLQYLGYHAYHANIPAWFHEGLAELVSGGCGSTGVSEDQAARAIAGGTKLHPDTKGSAFVIKHEEDYGLERSMFYRQCSMFVFYLKHRDEVGFRAFIMEIEDGENFEKTFRKVFGVSVGEAWKEFEKSVAPEPSAEGGPAGGGTGK